MTDPFVTPVAMEEDLDGCFTGDRGVLDPAVRRVLVRLLQRRFLSAGKHPADWKVLLDNQQVIESRLHDLFVRLVVDVDRGLAYKQQVRGYEADETAETAVSDIPVLLRDEAYTRAETLVLVCLRSVWQRESTAGEPSARVDVEEVEQTVLTYFTESDGDLARRQKSVRRALERLRHEGIVEEETEGRYLISPLIEIVLSAQKLRELADWLSAHTDRTEQAGELQ
jgi:DNA-binding transcriptional ArsR family regulator